MQLLIKEGNGDLLKNFREENQRLETSIKEILDSKVVKVTTLVQSNSNKVNENADEISNLKEQVFRLLEINSLQSNQLEELQHTHKKTEEHLLKRINEIEASLAIHAELTRTQNIHLNTTNSNLTETIKDVQRLKENPTDFPQELIDSKVNEILKQKESESHWQKELDKTAQKLVFKNLKKTPATVDLHPSRIFNEHILQLVRAPWKEKAAMTPTAVIDLNRTKPNSSSHLLLCSFGSPEGISLI